MAIAFVNGASNTNGAATSLAVTYTSTAGNTLFFYAFAFSGGTITVTDNTSTAWTSAGAAVGARQLFYRFNSPVITSVTMTVTGTARAVAAVVAEYSGITSIVGTAVETDGAPPLTNSKAITAGNTYIVGVGPLTSGTATVLFTTGTLRKSSATIKDTPGTLFVTSAIGDSTTGTAVMNWSNAAGNIGVAMGLEVAGAVVSANHNRLGMMGCGT